MEGEDIPVGGNLRVQGNHQPAGAVIVNDQIVYAEDGFMAHYNGFNFFNKFRFGRLSQKRTDRIFCGFNPREENEKPDQNPAVPVYPKAGEMRTEGGGQHDGSGQRIA